MLDDDLERMHKALGERVDDITDRKKHYVMKKIYYEIQCCTCIVLRLYTKLYVHLEF